MESQLLGNFWTFLHWYGAPAIMAVVSAIYFFSDQRRPAYRARLISSSHGLIGVFLYFGAFAIGWVHSHEYRPHLGAPYISLYFLPLSSIIIAFYEFQGPRSVHLLQIPNVVALTWSLFLGAMAITGDWI
jgi:hypothetical protein